MLRGFKAITVTHKSISVGDLGAYVVPEYNDSVGKHIRLAQSHFGIGELMYLQTCNRILFLLYDDAPETLPSASQLFAFFHPEKDPSFYNQLNRSITEYVQLEAVEHIFSVAASVDSLVVGEREILRQLRNAYEDCNQQGLTGDSIRLLMKYAIEAAKKVYNDTRIGEKSVSVASLATTMLFDKGVQPQDPILLVGAGETNTIIAKVLKKKGYHNIDVFNRSLPKAQFLASITGGQAHELSQLDSHQKDWKAMVVCTGSLKPIITRPLFDRLINSSESQPKIILDLAIPKNVDDEVILMDSVTYIEIEGVRSKAEEHLAFRQKEVKNAVKIIHSYGKEFMRAFQQRQVEKALQDLPDAIHDVKNRAINQVFQKDLDQLDTPTRELVLKMMDYMEKKCVGIPMKVARSAV